MTDTYKQKFVAFLTGLEMQCVDELVEQDIEFIKEVATQMNKRIKERIRKIVVPISQN